MSKKKSISASSARIGSVYLTRQRIPVQIKKITSRSVEVFLTLLKKPMTLKRSTPLFAYDKSKVKKTNILRRLKGKKKRSIQNIQRTESTAVHLVQPVLVSQIPETSSAKQVHRGPKGPRHLSVTNVVDPMLLAGTYTRQEINAALGESEVGKSLANRDMGWYTAYRISVLKEKGYLFEKLSNDVIRIYNPVLNLGLVKPEPEPVLVVLKN